MEYDNGRSVGVAEFLPVDPRPCWLIIDVTRSADVLVVPPRELYERLQFPRHDENPPEHHDQGDGECHNYQDSATFSSPFYPSRCVYFAAGIAAVGAMTCAYGVPFDSAITPVRRCTERSAMRQAP